MDEYFKNLCESRKEQGKDGWIDFESEISQIIHTLDSASHTIAEQVAQGQKNGKMTQYQYSILRPVIGQKWSSEKYNSFFLKIVRLSVMENTKKAIMNFRLNMNM